MVERDGGRLVVTVVTALALTTCGHNGSSETGAGGAAAPPTDAKAMPSDADANADAATDIVDMGSDLAEAGKWREAGADGVRSDSGVASLCGVSTAFGTLPPMAPIPYRAVSIAVADLNADDRPDVVIRSSDEWGTGMITVSVLLGMGMGRFASRVDYDFGDGPASLVVADVNGDQRPDVIVARGNGDGGDRVSVRLAVGDGTLGPQRDYPTGRAPANLAVADVNGDGQLDVVTPNHFDAAVSVLLGIGDGTFAARTDFPAGDCPSVASLGDLNGDGKLDLVTDSCTEADGVLLGTGDGKFGVKQDLPMKVGRDLLADVNGDGKVDLFTGVGLFLGRGDGTFASGLPVLAADTATAMVLEDADQDGKLDVLVAEIDTNRVSVLRGMGDGTFGAPTIYPGRGGPAAVGVGDFDGDGTLDLIAANHGEAIFSLAMIQGANVIEVLPGLRDGRFDVGLSYPTGGLPAAMVLADLTGDGRADLAAANRDTNLVSLLRGAGDGTFSARQDYPTGRTPRALAVADLDHDHKLDVVTANFDAGTVSVLLGTGGGDLAAKVDYPVGGYPTAVALGDLNGDGNVDLAVSNGRDRAVSVLLGTGAGKFAAQASVYPTGYFPRALAIGDLDGDGNPDVAVTNAGIFADFSVSVLSGTGDGTLRAGVDYRLGGQFSDFFGLGSDDMPQSVHLADLNGDGRLDVIAADWTTSTVSVLLGRSDGTLAPTTTYPTGYLPGAVTVADLNGDGKPDLATMNGGATLSVLLGMGDGTFGPNVDFPAGSAHGGGERGGETPSQAGIAAGDLNGDGRPDIVVASDMVAAVSTLLNGCP